MKDKPFFEFFIREYNPIISQEVNIIKFNITGENKAITDSEDKKTIPNESINQNRHNYRNN